MSEHRFLAFDCGATSCRAILATIANGGFGMEEVCRFPNNILEKDGRYYWDVNAIYENFVQSLTDLGGRGIHIDSIGIDTWGVDFGHIAADGTLLGLPRSYRDPYTNGIPEKVLGIVPRDELYSATGIQIMDFNSVFQLYAQKQERSAQLEQAKHILFMPDLLAYMLTGNKVCEYTIASTSGMINPRTRTFDSDLLERLGIDKDLLLPVVQPGTVVGTLCSDIATRTGLGEVPVVAVAGHDTASAIAAVPADSPNFAYLSSGTWSLMGIETEQPIINAQSEALNFTNEGGIEGTTRFLKNITGMWLVEQCRKAWTAQGRNYTYPEMVEMATKSEGYAGRINPDNQRFANPADMDAEIRADLAENGFPAPKSDGDMLSCIYHSLAERYAQVLDMLRQFAPFPIEKLHIIGGGSANTLLNRWTAEATGIPIIAGPTEATAIGNVMVQAKAAGLVRDRWEMRRLVEN